MAERNGIVKCAHCGGQVMSAAGERKCLQCGRTWQTKADMYIFYNAHMDEIAADARKLGIKTTEAKWQIPSNGLCKILWNHGYSGKAPYEKLDSPPPKKAVKAAAAPPPAPKQEPDGFIFTITGDDLRRLEPADYDNVWAALGKVTRCRLKENREA